MDGLSSFEQTAVWAVLVISILGIVYAFILRQQILAQDKGTQRMQEVWGFIKSGANAYLSQQFRTIAILIVILTFVLGASVLIIPPTREAIERFGSIEAATLWVAIGRAIAFLMGSLFSYTVGFVGMNVAVEGNVRVAAAARKGYDPAMQVAYRSGSVTGMLTVGLGLLGGTLIFMVFGIAAPDALLGFGFGGSRSRCLCASAEVSTPRRPMSAPTLSGKLRPASPRTTRAMLRSSQTLWATMSGTAPAWPPTSLRALRSRLSRR
jgi:K(+)-stimulated pyrophosphate-energized sodium pump